MQGKGIRITVSLLLVVMLVFGFIAPGQASTLEDRKKELNQVNRMIQQRKQQLAENNKKKQNVIQELNTIDQDISQTSQDLQRIANELAALQKAIQKTEKELKEKEADLEKRTQFLYQRLEDIYMDGQVSYLEVLLQSTSMSDFLTRLDLMQYIAEQDSRLVRELAAERDQIEQHKKELVNKKEEVAVLQETTRAKQTYLAARRSDREAALGQLETERKAYLRAMQELEASSRNLTNIIQQMQSKNQKPRQGTGRFIWPVSGPITSNYGMRYHPILHQSRLHSGVDIGASGGTPIKAADDGTVIYSGWMGGYGQVVVLDHGGGYSTLYAHMSSIAVGKGSGVTQGQTIGRVGSTGWSTGPHLHFEVRINGNTQNPLNYL